jgi:hypothetical protein
MNSINKLTIQGNVSDGDIEELREVFNQQDFEISKYTMLSRGEHELINFLFQYFHVISFTRDFILSAVLTSSLKFSINTP